MNNQDLHSKGLISTADGLGTPKFKDEDSLAADDANLTFYVRKRLQMQARKELFALENYRSETYAMPPTHPNKQPLYDLESLKAAELNRVGGEDSSVKKINTMECRVKHMHPVGRGLGGHVQPAHSSKDSMLSGFIAAGPSSSLLD